VSSPVIANCVFAIIWRSAARQCRPGGAARIRQCRKVFSRQRLHARVETIRCYFDPVLVFFDPDVGLRQSLDDFVELLCRQRQRTALAHRRIAAAAQGDLEVGRQHPHFVAVGFDQHVGQNRNRVFPLDDALEQLQFSQKRILPDNEFHRRVATSSGVLCPRLRRLGEPVIPSI